MGDRQSVFGAYVRTRYDQMGIDIAATKNGKAFQRAMAEQDTIRKKQEEDEARRRSVRAERKAMSERIAHNRERSAKQLYSRVDGMRTSLSSVQGEVSGAARKAEDLTRKFPDIDSMEF